MSEKKIEKKSFNFGSFWQKYGTLSILLLILVLLAVARPSAVFTATILPSAHLTVEVTVRLG